jgi:signal peptidase II
MKNNKIIRNSLILMLLLTNVGCDQISKYIVREKVDFNEQIILIDNFVTITKVENTGAFLGLGHHISRIEYKIFMIIMPLVVLGYALWYLLTRNNLSKTIIVGICLIIGGGLGNIYDRILFGSVTDFLYFDFQIFHTGIVNFADISLTSGFFIVLYALIFNQRVINFKTS